MKLKYFGTDGLRGKGFTDLTAELAYKLGQGLKPALNSNQVIIGMDTRSSSNMLAHMLAAGALSTGLNVLFAGVVSTPMIAHYSKLKQISGIMITASHNPYEDNGIKVFNKGYKSTLEEELIIESYIDGKTPETSNFGTYTLTNDVKEAYLNLISQLNLKTSSLKIAYDSANGANYLIANQILSTYYPQSIQLSNQPNGLNINLNCGSTHLETLISYIKEHQMDLGFAYDGDGDRVMMVGKDGFIYDGDFIIYLVATYLKDHNQLKNNTVVLTKMSNPGILKALKAKDINYILTDVGDKYVSEALVKNDYIIGGEASGHIILRNILHSGDGLLASLYILKLLEEHNLSLEEITKDIKLYPFKMVNIKNINKSVLQQPEVIKYLEDTKNHFDKEDIFLIRASGTEPLIRVTISCEDENKLNQYMEKVVTYLKEKGEK